jgi:thioredoxin 1
MSDLSTLENLNSYSLSNPSKLLVIDFKASWCAPCKAIKPFIDYLKENYPNVDFYEIDIEDESKETIVNNFDIVKLPTFLYYKNGKVCETLIGTNKSKIEELVNEFL